MHRHPTEDDRWPISAGKDINWLTNAQGLTQTEAFWGFRIFLLRKQDQPPHYHELFNLSGLLLSEQ
jgi:hypothetical protein